LHYIVPTPTTGKVGCFLISLNGMTTEQSLPKQSFQMALVRTGESSPAVMVIEGLEYELATVCRIRVGRVH
jgi:hypothetical protein